MLCAMRIGSMAVIATALLASTAAALDVDVKGNVTNKNDRNKGTIKGTYTIDSFEIVDGELVANTIFNGVVRNKNGQVVRKIRDREVQVPVTNIDAIDDGTVCQVLSLTLGPLDLNVLGLIVQLDEVNLDITADPTGGLLGQLLCDLSDLLGVTVTDLLDNLSLANVFDILDLLGNLDPFLTALNDFVLNATP